MRVIEILIDEGVDHAIFLDFLQVSVLALILKIHLHTGVVIHLRWWLMIELKLRSFAADLPLFEFSCLCYLREDNTARTSAFLCYSRN